MSNWQSEREDYLAGKSGDETVGCLPWLLGAILLIGASLGLLCLSVYFQLTK